jgi:hypothetical protein
VANRPNPSIQGTVEKLRFSIPSALRASAAPDLERYAPKGALVVGSFGKDVLNF